MMERESSERAFHDEHYRAVFDATVGRDPFTDGIDLYLRHALSSLGPVADREVLDCGTGDGDLSLWLAREGARVTSFDISAESLRLARERARRLDVADRIRFLQCSFEDLPLGRARFDAAIGSLILHHVDVGAAGRELDRVLRPGARAVFSENFGMNPLLMFARNHLIGRLGIPRLGTLTEKPLGAPELQVLGRFLSVDLSFPDFLFFKLLDRQVFRYRFRLMNRLCTWLDRFLFENVPALHRYSYRGTILLTPLADGT